LLNRCMGTQVESVAQRGYGENEIVELLP